MCRVDYDYEKRDSYPQIWSFFFFFKLLKIMTKICQNVFVLQRTKQKRTYKKTSQNERHRYFIGKHNFLSRYHISLYFCCRFLRKQSRMDSVTLCPGPQAGYSGVLILWEVRSSASLPNGIVHARGVSRGWTLQEGDSPRRAESSVVDQRWRGTSWTTGNHGFHYWSIQIFYF